MSKKNKSKVDSQIKQDLRNNGKTYYKGFIIKECLNDFGRVYYTIINPTINSHVHASTLLLSIKICDLTKSVLYNPYITPTLGRGYSLDVYERAYRLAFRQTERNKKGKVK